MLDEYWTTKTMKNNFFIIVHQSAEKVVQKRNITQLRWEVAFWLEGKSLKSIFCLLPDLAFFVLSKVSVFFASLSIGFFTKAFRSTTWFLQSVPLQKQTENLVFCHSSGRYCQCLFPFQLHEEKTAFSKFNARVANVQYYFFFFTWRLLLFTKFCSISKVDKSRNPGLSNPKSEFGLIRARIGLYWIAAALDFWCWAPQLAQKELAISLFLFANAKSNGDGEASEAAIFPTAASMDSCLIWSFLNLFFLDWTGTKGSEEPGNGSESIWPLQRLH